jgi:hypothetical protein
MSTQPPPNSGTTITQGVKYLKINRLDKDGEDFDQRLALADNIRINYPDIGAVQYNILTTQQQGDSYLMGLIPQDTTSSINEILDYRVEAEKNSLNNSITDSLTSLNSIISPWDSVSNNLLGYFDSSNSKYNLGNTPNIPLNFTFSGSFNWLSVASAPAEVVFSIGVEDNSDQGFFVLTTGSYTSSPANTLTNEEFEILVFLTGSSALVENDVINFYVNSNVVGGQTLTLNNDFYLLISSSQDAPPISATETLINISPEQLNFQWSDYNAVFGNASDPQFSEVFMDVDYSGNYITPINFELIYSGSALKASVQDSNYTQRGWSNGRYNGSRNSSQDFNQ